MNPIGGNGPVLKWAAPALALQLRANLLHKRRGNAPISLRLHYYPEHVFGILQLYLMMSQER